MDSSSSRRARFLFESESTDIQAETELECSPFFVNLHDLSQGEIRHLQEIDLVDDYQLCLLKEKHEEYLKKALYVQPLKASFVSLDASKPWMVYWILQSLDLMEKLPNNGVLCNIVVTLRSCFEGTGFGGGPGQMAHAAPTYAAVMALSIVATCSDKIDASRLAYCLLQEARAPLQQWFLSLKTSTGGFAIHRDGEQDVRATYCILSCARLLNFMTSQLTEGAVEFLLQCQTYEGGFGGEPGNEAHGGYTYCAIAALEILGALPRVDMASLRSWLVQRQMPYEGGFNGRSNKLVDGCYSFWQGAALAIVSSLYEEQISTATASSIDENCSLLFDESMLQRYILLCAQDLNGGLRDKPSKPRDFYHSCYNLSGLSVSQSCGSLAYGHATKSRVAETDPCYNIRVERVEAIRNYFATGDAMEAT